MEPYGEGQGQEAEARNVEEMREILGLSPSEVSNEQLRHFLGAANGDLNIAINHYFNAESTGTLPRVAPTPRPPSAPGTLSLASFLEIFREIEQNF